MNAARCTSVVLAVTLAAGCCPTFNFGGTSGPLVPGTPAAPGTATPKGGHFSGHVFGPDGKPLSNPAAKVKVGVSGVSAAGQEVGFSPPVDANGAFDIEVPRGTYHSSATLQITWKGKLYRYDLEPVGDSRLDRPSENGIVQDFTWRLTGQRPNTQNDPSNHTCWFGACISAQFQSYRNDVKKGVPQPPAGSKAVFTVEPTGPLIDGTTGKTLTFERPFDKVLGGLTNNLLNDIPVGSYKVTGVLVSPDGKAKPLRMQVEFAKFADAHELTFEPDSGGKVWPHAMGFTYDTE